MSKFKDLSSPGGNKEPLGESKPPETGAQPPVPPVLSKNQIPDSKESSEAGGQIRVTPVTEISPQQGESVLIQELVRVLKGMGNNSADTAQVVSHAVERALSKNTTADTVLSDDIVSSQYTSDDVLDEPMMFFRPCGGQFIDMGGPGANGGSHYPPFRDRYNKIVPMIWNKGPEIFTGYGLKGERIVQRFAQYICKSKKELEYIRKHRDFGTLILEKTIDVAYTTNNFINALGNASKKIAHMNQVDRIMFARDRGIDVEKEPSEWYNELVVSLAKEETKSMNLQLGQISDMFESLKNTVEHPGSRGKSSAGFAPLAGHESVLAIHRTVEV